MRDKPCRRASSDSEPDHLPHRQLRVGRSRRGHAPARERVDGWAPSHRPAIAVPPAWRRRFRARLRLELPGDAGRQPASRTSVAARSRRELRHRDCTSTEAPALGSGCPRRKARNLPNATSSPHCPRFRPRTTFRAGCCQGDDEVPVSARRSVARDPDRHRGVGVGVAEVARRIRACKQTAAKPTTPPGQG